MPGQFLDCPSGCPAHREMGAERVAKDVHTTVPQSCLSRCTTDIALNNQPRRPDHL